MQKFLVLTGFILLGFIGLCGHEPQSKSAIVPIALDSDYLGSPIVPAVLYSETNTTEMWGRPAELTEVVVRRRYYRHYRRRRVVVRRRPFSHSAAIVGGSAAGGAAIGALAGGGKGAAIGALAGGGAGLIYDRKTHKKRVVVRE